MSRSWLQDAPLGHSASHSWGPSREKSQRAALHNRVKALVFLTRSFVVISRRFHYWDYYKVSENDWWTARHLEGLGLRITDVYCFKELRKTTEELRIGRILIEIQYGSVFLLGCFIYIYKLTRQDDVKYIQKKIVTCGFFNIQTVC
jgi:hypothetical protein